jgi:23S rRNA pseudouridine2605 synthase
VSAAGQQPERLQKVLARLGLASRREAEAWIRAGRLSVNGRPATLGMRVSADDHLRLDGRPIRQPVRGARAAGAYLCHRSPGEALMGDEGEGVAARLPRSAGPRFIAVSPMPRPDGGLELLTADGDLAARLQRAVRTAEVEFTVRVRGELTPEQEAGLRGGELDGGRLDIIELEPAGGEGSNRWYRLLTRGASGNEVRQLVARQGIAVVRVLRTRLGALTLPRELARGRSHALSPEQVAAFLHGPVTDELESSPPHPPSPEGPARTRRPSRGGKRGRTP